MTYNNESLASEHNIAASISERGFYILKETEKFSANIYVDFFNQRLKVLSYIIEDYYHFIHYLDSLATEYKLGKLIITAKEKDWQPLLGRGLNLEALHPTFFSRHPGYHLAKFYSSGRRNCLQWENEENILNQVFRLSSNPKALSPNFAIRSAHTEDIPLLVQLYSSIFKTYPTTMDDQQYIKDALETDTHFMIILDQGKIASAASLDIDMNTKSAELTDCATLPEYRGLSLMSNLVNSLEDKARNIGLTTVYTIARATSFGINAVFFRREYVYYGRFINNCDICGKFEDMNLWSKQL